MARYANSDSGDFKCFVALQSCTKAYEFIGMIMEKEAAYKDASEHYQKAWNYGNKNQPSIGKLSNEPTLNVAAEIADQVLFKQDSSLRSTT